MIDCILTPISADRGICLECDPDGRHPLFLGARRTCTKPAPPPKDYVAGTAGEALPKHGGHSLRSFTAAEPSTGVISRPTQSKRL